MQPAQQEELSISAQNNHKNTGAKFELHPRIFIITLPLTTCGILTAVSYSTYINALFINIKIKLIPFGKQCNTGRIFQVGIRIDRKLERVCFERLYDRFILGRQTDSRIDALSR